MEEGFGAEILDALANLLTVASEMEFLDQVGDSVEECGLFHTLKELQNHHDQAVSGKAAHIVETFFEEACGFEEAADSFGILSTTP
jgi:hypothetical protein